jgi:hypothetical protein
MKMKIATSVVLFLALALFTQCGPGAKQMEEQNAEKAVTASDSIASRASEMNDLDISFRAPEGKKFIRTAETKFRVSDVRRATETVENMAAEAGGYVTYSNLRNTETDNSRDRISRDSVMISRQVVVENEMILRIPNENLDTLVRKLNKLVLFLDYRVIKMDDVTYALMANQKAAARLQAYDQRQKQHIDAEANKLKEKTGAEEARLQKQTLSDENEIRNLMIEDQVKYCNFTLVLYQSPVFVTETIGLVNADAYRPNLFIRIWEAIADGWVIFEYFIIFLFRIWWVFLLTILVVVGFRVFRKEKKG